MEQKIENLLVAARKASRTLLGLDDECIDALLRDIADELVASTDEILAANADDLSRMDHADPKYDRLQLTADRVAAIAADMRSVSRLPSPLNRVLEERTLPNGLELSKVSVPFGVIGVIFEARPNVSCDVASLCLKSGNACVLKGGHEAAKSNEALVSVIHRVMRREGIDEDAVTLLPADREATACLLGARGLVDLIIPRGSSRLISYVRENATIPVIETGAGVCHTYVDLTADRDMARAITVNGKTRRVSVCNALDCLLINRGRLQDLAYICAPMADKNVILHADDEAYRALEGAYPVQLLRHATAGDFGTEYLSYAMAVKTVGSLGEAIDHIARYGSGHSEAIVTADPTASRRFSLMVDAACVYTNAPTSFTDGAQFGLGAEIGISTQKLHARGPMALRELTTYKWLIRGNGQTRP